MNSNANSRTSPNAFLYGILIFVIVAGVALRVFGGFTDFWLDEIWTLWGVRGLRSFSEIFTKYTDYNNHHLNTLFFFLVGETRHWIVYRIPSLIAGTLTIPLVWIAARRVGRLEAGLATGITAASYLLCYYSSEARGYALVLFFAVAAWYALERIGDASSRRWRFIFWLSVILGFLSQLIFTIAFIGFLLWFPFRCRNSRMALQEIALNCAKVFGVPLLFMGFFYLAVVRRMTIGGGPDYRLIDVIIQALSFASGGGEARSLFSYGSAVLTACIFLLSVFRLWQKKTNEWVFFLVVIFVAPAAAFLLHPPSVLFVRYFLISILFGYIASAFLFAALLRRQGAARVVAIVFLLLFTVGNAFQAIPFIRYGRGGYLKALYYIERNSPGNVITLGTDHPVRNLTTVEFYRVFLNPATSLIYILELYPDTPSPQWIILHAIGQPPGFPDNITDRQGSRYIRKGIYPCAGPSGFNWSVYKRE